MIGLVVGLRVGLLGMEHWVAKSLNLWRVAICFVDLRDLKDGLKCVCVCSSIKGKRWIDSLFGVTNFFIEEGGG